MQGRTTSLEKRFAMATFGTILGFAVMMTLDVALSWVGFWGSRRQQTGQRLNLIPKSGRLRETRLSPPQSPPLGGKLGVR
jgi:uncharacterized iron-regulated membrane protein